MKLQTNTQVYTSVTIWQGEPEWEIEVRVSGFPTIEAAADFGCNHAKTLKHEPNADYLILIDSSGYSHKIEHLMVFVHKLKLESREKLVVSVDDFIPVNVKIEDFSSIDGLDRGFGCLAYGVLDSNSVTLKF